MRIFDFGVGVQRKSTFCNIHSPHFQEQNKTQRQQQQQQQQQQN